MSSFSFLLRSTAPPFDPIAWIPPEAWLFFEYERKLNDVGSAQGILSTRRFTQLNDIFHVRTGGNLDAILEVWYQPPKIPGLPVVPIRLDAQYLLRYRRFEHLVNGKPRQTAILKDPKHLLLRPIIYPDDCLPVMVDDTAASLAAAIDIWVNNNPNPPCFPAVEDFTGNVSPSSTSEQMEAVVTHCATNSPIPFGPILIAPPIVGGIPDHLISLRYEDSLLEALQRMSASSWYAWRHGQLGTLEPVDFDLIFSTTNPFIPWTFTTFPGGRGTDRRINNPAGNVPLVFSPERDNVIQPVTITDRTEEFTRAIVAGQGSGLTRQLLALNNSTIADSPWNYIERFENASKIEDLTVVGGVEEAVVVGQRALRERGERREITFIARPTQGAQYGRDFDLGDLVSVDFGGDFDERQITNVLIQMFSDQALNVEIETTELDGRRFNGSSELERLLQLIESAEERIGYLEQDG